MDRVSRCFYNGAPVARALTMRFISQSGRCHPLTLQKLGRDPAPGASVLVTAIADSGGFFTFPGLVTIFLV